MEIRQFKLCRSLMKVNDLLGINIINWTLDFVQNGVSSLSFI